MQKESKFLFCPHMLTPASQEWLHTTELKLKAVANISTAEIQS